MDIGGHDVSLVGLALLGGGVGVVAGMFGVGGGFLLTPLLSVVFDIPLPIAVGTGLCQMVGTAVVALLRHRKLGQGEVRFDCLMFAGSMVGVGAGTAVVTWLERAGRVSIGSGSLPTVTVVLYGGYVSLLAACSWLFWRQGASASSPGAELGLAPLERLRWGPVVSLPNVEKQGSALVIAYIGLIVGFLSGLLGIGGGVALMPILIYGFGFPIRQAAGTGILALLLTVIVGTVQHATVGHVHLGLACTLLVGSTLSAQLGATLTRKLPAHTLRRLFSILLWFTIAAIAWDVWGRLSPAVP